MPERKLLQTIRAGEPDFPPSTSEALPPLRSEVLPPGLRSRHVRDVNGLSVHVLEAGFAPAGRPAVLLLHGFPELAYSWRKVMLPLAAAGYHVIAPDQRGFGRTVGWDGSYDADPAPFRMLSMVRDAIGLVFALGHRTVAAVVGHDSGSYVAAWCALLRPDLFRALAMMSAPFPGPPPLPFGAAAGRMEDASQSPWTDLDAGLAALDPPRKYYQDYYTTREANGDMQHAPQGLRAFLRGYYHVKSADWRVNAPLRLQAATAAELAKMPTYYVMDRSKTMAETVAAEMPSAAEIAACRWLSEDELGVYVEEYGRTGFQGGLQAYRRAKDPLDRAALQIFAGRSIDVPACFIAGKADWGVYQAPGVFESMQSDVCTNMRAVHLVENAGHWVQQERPSDVSRLLLGFLEDAHSPAR